MCRPLRFCEQESRCAAAWAAPSRGRYDSPSDGLRGSPTCGKARQPTACRLGLAVASSERENFVANEVQTYGLRFRAIKEESFDCLSDIGAQLFPTVALRHNTFRQALSNKAAVSFFCNLKYQLADVNRFHANFLSQELSMEVSTMPASLSRGFSPHRRAYRCDNSRPATFAVNSPDFPRGTLSDSHFPVFATVRCFAT